MVNSLLDSDSKISYWIWLIWFFFWVILAIFVKERQEEELFVRLRITKQGLPYYKYPNGMIVIPPEHFYKMFPEENENVENGGLAKGPKNEQGKDAVGGNL